MGRVRRLGVDVAVRPGHIGRVGSRKEQLVDKLGDPDSIFEKMRLLISGWPREFWSKGFSPADHMPHMKIVNPETGATITGEAGDNIGRGGRKSIYFKDEAGHYERPEKIEAALADNTRVQIDISSVNGPGNVFHRRREAGVEWGGGPAVPGVTNVFIFDWRDHPAKDDDWYEARRRKAEAEGLRHVFAQEVDRNYFAAVEGTIINATWVRAAIDAHVKLGLADEGAIVGGLDVADEGGDRNALALRRGPLLLSAEEWGDGDTGTTARRAITRCSDLGMPVELQYDSVGVGAGVKAEANRLDAEGKLPRGIRMTPWSAGAGPIGPDDHVEPGDEQTPLNRDFYANLKAQGWWQLRRRFEKTWRALNEGVVFPAEELISLPSDLPMLRQIEKELCQPTATRSTGSLKLVVNKTPAGTRSPNVADAIVMAYWPVLPKERKTFTWYAGGEAIEG